MIFIERGSISIGSTTSRLLPNLFSEYLSLHPYVKFRLFQVLQHAEIQKLLTIGEIDLSISSLPVKHPEIQYRPLIAEKIYLAVPSNHRLAQRKSIQLKEIADEPLIYYTTKCGLREIIDNFCYQAEFVPNIAFECTTPEVICGLVKAGFAIAFIPAYLWQIIDTDALTQLHIENPTCERTIWLSWSKKHYRSTAVRDFSQFLIEYFSQAK